VDEVLSKPDGVLHLIDKRGRQVLIPAAKIAYVEVGSADDGRRVGFGAPKP
jgi:hypothetical protein